MPPVSLGGVYTRIVSKIFAELRPYLRGFATFGKTPMAVLKLHGFELTVLKGYALSARGGKRRLNSGSSCRHCKSGSS